MDRGLGLSLYLGLGLGRINRAVQKTLNQQSEAQIGNRASLRIFDSSSPPSRRQNIGLWIPSTGTGCKKVASFANPNLARASTSHTERQNLTVRMSMRRMTPTDKR